ncbi:hypothetical protein Fmac_028791 [Flemingia macrophylla]|uniref:Ribosomal protein S11 n=1 Tax=Flemingia macrophylla TaxID=520843 RepID=A0ABD1L8H9_9FABA
MTTSPNKVTAAFDRLEWCHFTGNVSIRGRFLVGTCHSAKMNSTIIVRRNYLHFIKKYQRYEKWHSNIAAHISPCFHVKERDYVIIGQCRPLSKTVRFNVLKVILAGSSSGAKKAFTGIWIKFIHHDALSHRVTRALPPIFAKFLQKNTATRELRPITRSGLEYCNKVLRLTSVKLGITRSDIYIPSVLKGEFRFLWESRTEFLTFWD